MSEAAVQLKVAGKTYQVVTSADPDELGRLAGRVEEALASVSAPGREPSAQALILAAITLAHDLEEEKAARVAAERRHREFVQKMMGRIDRALQTEEPEPVYARRGAARQKKSRSV